MDLLDLLKSSGGDNSVGQMASALGLGSADTSKLVAALAPALMGSLTSAATQDNDLSKLRRALETGGHSRYIDNPDSMHAEETRLDGNKILGHIFGSKDVSRKVAQTAEQDTGIDASLIKKALPLLATLAMGAMAKKSAVEKDGGLGDLIGMAKKFF
jgi:hypothetical protein